MVASVQWFFSVELPNGNIAYTRNGSFKLDANGSVVNADGYKMIPEITIPEDATNIDIGVDGTVSVVQAGQTEATQIGQVELANFINPAGLHSLGDNLLINTEASGDAINGVAGTNGIGQLRQGFVELSNVS